MKESNLCCSATRRLGMALSLSTLNREKYPSKIVDSTIAPHPPTPMMVKSEISTNLCQVIPLVQTFGHLEFVLKHPSRSHLREVEEFSNCVAPIDVRNDADDVFRFLTSLIDDVVSLTPDCPAVHLGGDEVWLLGGKHKKMIQHSQSRKSMAAGPSAFHFSPFKFFLLA